MTSPHPTSAPTSRPWPGSWTRTRSPPGTPFSASSPASRSASAARTAAPRPRRAASCTSPSSRLRTLAFRASAPSAAVQGFGKVGRDAARFLSEAGVRIAAVGDQYGAIHADDGIDVPALEAHVDRDWHRRRVLRRRPARPRRAARTRRRPAGARRRRGRHARGQRRACARTPDRRRRQRPDDRRRPTGSSPPGASPSCPTSWPTPAA